MNERKIIYRISYGKRSLYNLLNLISKNSDKAALYEFSTNRRVFSYADRQLVFPDFLHKLHDNAIRLEHENARIIDCAYDKTQEKFMNFPTDLSNSDPSATKSEKRIRKPKAIDCRNYYSPLVLLIEEWKKNNPNVSHMEEEYKAAEIFQRFVIKHFYLSIKECRREQTPFSRRYFWKVKGKTISLKCPVEVAGREFRKWLEQNIDNPDPKRAGEANRIQAEVNKRFLQSVSIPWEEGDLQEIVGDKGPSHNMVPKPEEGTQFSQTLALAVAREKIITINEMRPAIKKLGQEMLRSMILRIFRDLDEGILEDNRIAKDFGLSKATFSRFAGSHWGQKLGEKKGSIPDLWINTSKVLASNSDFLETATAAGVLPNLKSVLKIAGGEDD